MNNTQITLEQLHAEIKELLEKYLKPKHEEFVLRSIPAMLTAVMVDRFMGELLITMRGIEISIVKEMEEANIPKNNESAEKAIYKLSSLSVLIAATAATNYIAEAYEQRTGENVMCELAHILQQLREEDAKESE